MDSRGIIRAAMQTIILFGAGLIVPLLGQFVTLFTPVPLVMLTVRSGWPAGSVAAALATAASAALAGWQAGLLLLAGFGLMAAGIAAGMRLRLRPESSVLLGGVLPVAAGAVSLAVFAAASGARPVAAAEEYLHASVREAVSLYQRLGLTDMAAVVTASENTFVRSAVRLLPGIALATSLIQAACCFGTARFFLQRGAAAGGGSAPYGGQLAVWHAPDSWVWGLIAALACVAVPLEAVKFIGWNAGIVFLVVYTAQGMAIVDFVLRRAGMGPVVRAVFHAVLLAMPTVLFLPPLGIVDIWADLRKVRTAGSGTRPASPQP